jgi:S-adenosyl-L-methionine hydrolase (adenosine-forming)
MQAPYSTAPTPTCETQRVPGRGRTIVFLSDFGYRNEWVGICHAVMNRIAPESPIVDLSHGVPPLDVRNGALLLVDSIPYLAADAILLAIVDPSVGRDRDLALETNDGRLVVGPDNGLLAPAAAALGGVKRAVEITSPDVVLVPISPSFHARDVLAPAAAHLAAGAALDSLGSAVDAATLAQMAVPEPTVEHGKIECEVLDLNRFGNVLLNVREPDLAASGLEQAGAVQIDATSGSAEARRVSTYADVEPGEWGLIVDPRGWVSVIRGNPANAAEGLGGVGSGDPIWLTTRRD